MSLSFEWEEEKASSNLRKHGVSFAEAITVFGDPLSLTIADPKHSQREMRWIDIGYSIRNRLLVVVYTERAHAIRLISSRVATKSERQAYEST